MRRWIPLSAVVAVALVVGLVGLVALVVRDTPASVSEPVAATASDDPTGRGEHHHGEGHGPPPWAGAGHDRDDRGQGHKAWHDAWKAMTPEQREQTMRRLASEHEDGMRAWARCVADGGDDCEKPLPPGQAKKQLRP
jgi:hypothetical protein